MEHYALIKNNEMKDKMAAKKRNELDFPGAVIFLNFFIKITQKFIPFSRVQYSTHHNRRITAE